MCFPHATGASDAHKFVVLSVLHRVDIQSIKNFCIEIAHRLHQLCEGDRTTFAGRVDGNGLFDKFAEGRLLIPQKVMANIAPQNLVREQLDLLRDIIHGQIFLDSIMNPWDGVFDPRRLTSNNNI